MDAFVENHGTVALVRPVSDLARGWIEDNVGDDAQFFGGALAVEPRYVEELVEGMLADGLDVGA